MLYTFIILHRLNNEVSFKRLLLEARARNIGNEKLTRIREKYYLRLIMFRCSLFRMWGPPSFIESAHSQRWLCKFDFNWCLTRCGRVSRWDVFLYMFRLFVHYSFGNWKEISSFFTRLVCASRTSIISVSSSLSGWFKLAVNRQFWCVIENN